MKILLFHNDPAFAEKIKKYFEPKGISIDILHGYDAVSQNMGHLNLFHYNGFILQIEKNNMEGVDIYEYMKLINIAVPVLFISAIRSIELLSLVFARGADDYLGGEFELKELELRLLKAIRFSKHNNEVNLPGSYVFNYSDQSISFGNIVVELTDKQQKLLLLLINHKNSVVTYEMIQESVYDGAEFSLNALASHIRDIRKKIKNIPIKSIRNVGYSLKLIECAQ